MDNFFTRFLAQAMFGLSSKWLKAFTNQRITLETRHGNQEILGLRAIFYGILFLLVQLAIFYIVALLTIKNIFPIIREWIW
jgi:inner membrane protein involved in colicin E2 resistance